MRSINIVFIIVNYIRLKIRPVFPKIRQIYGFDSVVSIRILRTLRKSGRDTAEYHYNRDNTNEQFFHFIPPIL